MMSQLNRRNLPKVPAGETDDSNPCAVQIGHFLANGIE
jgi:hypothetical protein